LRKYLANRIAFNSEGMVSVHSTTDRQSLGLTALKTLLTCPQRSI
jgi:hypothetical protein